MPFLKKEAAESQTTSLSKISPSLTLCTFAEGWQNHPKEGQRSYNILIFEMYKIHKIFYGT